MGESDEGPTRVVVAQASYLVREFLTTLLTAAPEIELAAVCSDADQLRAVIAAEDPDVVLTGIRMPPSGTDEGIRIATRLRETHPKIGVVVLSQYAEPSYALDLLGQGVEPACLSAQGANPNRRRGDGSDQGGLPGPLE